MRSPDAVVVANAGGISFVRVWYDEVLAGRLAGAAMRALSPLERYALVDDAWAAVVDGSTTRVVVLPARRGVHGTRPSCPCGS